MTLPSPYTICDSDGCTSKYHQILSFCADHFISFCQTGITGELLWLNTKENCPQRSFEERAEVLTLGVLFKQWGNTAAK
ncbi:hypothetical protein CHISP_1833 [Chitinispirillum alkaliphilum]|nr:hypothetical protein CHISP_1833 [Chitinispirillum alkaliphilum]